MSERKWTTHPKNGRKVIDAVTGHDICIAKAILGEPTKAWANARLIASAPALLAACETREADLARRCAGDNPCCAGCRELTELRELITKAKEPMR